MTALLLGLITLYQRFVSPLLAPSLPFRTNLFAIRRRGPHCARLNSRRVVGDNPYPALSSLRQRRIRPSADT